MCPYCGKAYSPGAVWVVNPERYFCTCPRVVPAATVVTRHISTPTSFQIWDEPVKRTDALRPSEV